MKVKNNLHQQSTTKTLSVTRDSLNRSLCSATLLLITLLASTITLADEVKMYSHVPSANEMANLLFPETSKSVRVRSISFVPDEKSRQFDYVEKIPQPVAESMGIGLPIKFDFDSDVITRDSRPYIDELGKMLSREDLVNETVVIEGHTDARGSEKYNLLLSMRRAQSIKRYLFKEYGIDRKRLLVSGKGEYSLLARENPFASVNRRVEIHKSQ